MSPRFTWTIFQIFECSECIELDNKGLPYIKIFDVTVVKDCEPFRVGQQFRCVRINLTTGEVIAMGEHDVVCARVRVWSLNRDNDYLLLEPKP